MKISHIFFVMVAVGVVAIAEAMPAMQHLVKGTVQSVDEGKHILVLKSTEGDQPSVFVVQEGRTRLRQDGKQATLGQLLVGQAVQVYYKKELGEWVATEVSWKAATPPKTGTP